MTNYITTDSTHAIGYNHGTTFIIPISEIAEFWRENPDSQTTFQFGTEKECEEMVDAN